jgi:hypothetical protein
MYEIYGLKMTKSEAVTGTNQPYVGEIVWDGANKKMRLGYFENKDAALFFAENVKNETDKKSWKITLENKEDNFVQEIHYVERDSSHRRRVYQHKMDKN